MRALVTMRGRALEACRYPLVTRWARCGAGRDPGEMVVKPCGQSKHRQPCARIGSHGARRKNTGAAPQGGQRIDTGAVNESNCRHGCFWDCLDLAKCYLRKAPSGSQAAADVIR